MGDEYLFRSQIVSGCKRLIFGAKVKSRFYAIQWFWGRYYQSVAADFYAQKWVGYE